MALKRQHVCCSVQADKPAKGKRKAPEPVEEDGSEDDELSSEDEPLPGEEDDEDSNDSDEDVLEHDDSEGAADELAAEEKPNAGARGKAGAPSKSESRTPASTQPVRIQHTADATHDQEDDSDEDMDEGIPFCIYHMGVCQQSVAVQPDAPQKHCLAA